MATIYNANLPQAFAYPSQPQIRVSSRSAYPTFLPLSVTLQLQIKWAWQGLYDSFRWIIVLRTLISDPAVRWNFYKSLFLNSLALASVYTFDVFLQPLASRNQPKWFHRNVGWFYQIMWLLPILGMSFYLNATWCSLIAKRTYILRHGAQAAAQQQPATYTGMLTAMATSAYRVVMVFTSVLVSFVLGSIPFVGPVIGFIFMCWIDSYYCFEFVWTARGMSLAKRIRHLEERWAYYLAFGLPSAALCSWGSGLANAAVFALIFPVYIILAMHARPLPTDPYNPLPPISSPSSGDNDTIRHPSPFIPIRLPVFALVVWLNDVIVKVLSVGGKPKRNLRHRAVSDAPESAEEGVGPTAPKNIGLDASKATRPAQARINIGRRKAD